MSPIAEPWKRFQEPVLATALRTGAIALVGGYLVARLGIGLSHFPLAVALVLWFSLGGHYVELFFLNWLRPRLPGHRAAHLLARLAVWFAGGIVLGYGMYRTADAGGVWTGGWLMWWIAGTAFVVIELFVHGLTQLRGKPNFYNGLS